MTVINAAKALEILEQVASEKPDHVNYECSYLIYPEPDTPETAKPGCIVGQAFYNLGTTLEQLHRMDCDFGGLAAWYVENSKEEFNGPLRLKELAGLELTPRAFKVLEVAQAVQDNRKTWGLAYEKARDWNERSGEQYSDDPA
jgi:hypothetical protein